MVLLECLECGIQVQDKVFVKMVEENNPLVSEEELQRELESRCPNFECYSCDAEKNKLVPADQADAIRRRFRESREQREKDREKFQSTYYYRNGDGERNKRISNF